MDHGERVALLRRGVPAGQGGTWAELGAGSGAFTRALAALLAAPSTLYAVDRDARALRQQRDVGAVHVVPLVADFTQPLDLPPLDGLLAANALHFVRDALPVLRPLCQLLRPGAPLLLVEYDLRVPRPWVPHPLPADRFPTLAARLGLVEPTTVGTRRSPSTGIVMYAARARQPTRS